MSEFAVTPDQTIEIAGQTYTLDGSFKTLKDIQNSTGEEILRFIAKMNAASFDDMAKVISLAITNAKGNAPHTDVIERAIIDDLGIHKTREHLFLWLALAVTPKAERQKKALDLAEALRKDRD